MEVVNEVLVVDGIAPGLLGHFQVDIADEYHDEVRHLRKQMLAIQF